MTKILSIIIPAFNEAKSIKSLSQNIPNFSQFNLKIILINDGSTDDTAYLAHKVGFIVKSNQKNLGLGKTFKLGLFYALNEGSDIIVILDGDGQYNAEDIGHLIRPLTRKKADLVIGNRFLSTHNPEMNIQKLLANKIISIFISNILLLLKETYDVQSSFRAFNARFGRFIYKNLKGEYNYAQEMFILAILFNYRIKQIPIKCYKRLYGKSKLIKNPFLHLFKILTITLKTYFKIRFLH